MPPWLLHSLKPPGTAQLPSPSQQAPEDGGGVKSMLSSNSENHSMDLWGTPYSCSKMPRIHNWALD